MLRMLRFAGSWRSCVGNLAGRSAPAVQAPPLDLARFYEITKSEVKQIDAELLNMDRPADALQRAPLEGPHILFGCESESRRREHGKSHASPVKPTLLLNVREARQDGDLRARLPRAHQGP